MTSEQTIRITATIESFDTALKWVLDAKPDTITVTIDPETNTASLRHTSKMGSPVPGYHEHPITPETVTGDRKVSAHLADPNQLRQALKLASFTAEMCTLSITLNGNEVREAVVTAGVHNTFRLSTSTLARNPRPVTANVGSLPTYGLAQGIKVARSVNNGDDQNSLYVIFKLNDENELEVMASTSAGRVAVLMYKTPFTPPLVLDAHEASKMEIIKAGVSILPETKNFKGETVEVLVSEQYLGFRDSETGAIALYENRNVPQQFIQSFRTFILDKRGYEFEQNAEVDVANLKLALQAMHSADKEATETSIIFDQSSNMQVKLGEWVVDLPVNDEGITTPFTAKVQYVPLSLFATAHIAPKCTVSFLPEGKEGGERLLMTHSSSNEASTLFVVTSCSTVTTN